MGLNEVTQTGTTKAETSERRHKKTSSMAGSFVVAA